MPRKLASHQPPLPVYFSWRDPARPCPPVAAAVRKAGHRAALRRRQVEQRLRLHQGGRTAAAPHCTAPHHRHAP
eukprot:1473630-Prymnesium_polylepis.1